MKYFLIPFFVVLFLFSACNVLDQEPQNLAANQEAITDVQSATSAVNGLFFGLQATSLYSSDYILAIELMSGNAIATAFQQYYQELDRGIVPTSNVHITDVWSDAYLVINAANTILRDVPNISSIPEEEQGTFTGPAHFFRAFATFDLLRYYGEHDDIDSQFGVPLPKDPFDEPREEARATVEGTYSAIESDLNQALLAEGGVISRGVIYGLSARVALYKKDYQTALEMAELAIDSDFPFPDNYSDIFLLDFNSMLELDFTTDNPNGWSVFLYNSPAEVSASRELFESFENGDTRRELYAQVSENAYVCNKYGFTNADIATNTILFRLAEMYLIRAEAKAMQGDFAGGVADLNITRVRAGLAPLDASGIATEEAFIDALLQERRVELAFEGHHWFDMVRLNRYQSIIGNDDFRRIFPIPFREMNITDGTLIQNPGY